LKIAALLIEALLPNNYNRLSLIWSKKCSACGFAETERDEFEAEKSEREKKKRKDIELLNKHRAEFCLSASEGEEYLQSIAQLQMLKQICDEAELKRTDPDYKKVETLNKWSVVELEKNLSEALEIKRYAKLRFDKPEIDKYVIIPFTVQDASMSRKERRSERELRRSIKTVLADSNWRLMNESVSYRLGYVSGRLKGYEREEDLVQIMRGGRRKK